MTIYTDQVTGKKYDRVFGAASDQAGGSASCLACAFHADTKKCDSASKYCVIITPAKTVVFVFKERKA